MIMVNGVDDLTNLLSLSTHLVSNTAIAMEDAKYLTVDADQESDGKVFINVFAENPKPFFATRLRTWRTDSWICFSIEHGTEYVIGNMFVATPIPVEEAENIIDIYHMLTL